MEYSPSENPSKPQRSAAEWLREHPRFEGLANQSPATEIQLLEYTAGETIHSPGRQFHQSALILSGQAALALVHSDGTQTLVCNLESGECFGERLTAGSSNDSIIVRAVSDLVVLRMPSDQLDGLINRSSSLASEIGDSIEARRQAVLAAKRLHQSQAK
jgi:CRP-like cAMP-binding protein